MLYLHYNLTIKGYEIKTQEIKEIVEKHGYKSLNGSNEYCLLFRQVNNQDIYLDINIEPDEDEDYTHEIHLYNGVSDEVFFSKFMSEEDFNNNLKDILIKNK